MEKTLNPFNSKTIKHMALIGVISSGMLASAHAETLSPLVVTAGRIAENPANISTDVSVITRKDIETSQAENVADILRTQTGLTVTSSGGVGTNTSVFIRGANSGHTLVLIDGVRVGSATLGAFDWGNLSTADVERIEIVRGPQSSLYGADAIGGVIQIFTRKGLEGTQIQVSAESGAYATNKFGVGVQGGSESGTTYAFLAETFKTDGFSVAASGTEDDPSKRTTLSGQLGFISGKMELDLSVRNVDATTSVDGYDPTTFSFGDLLEYENRYKQNVSTIKLTDHVSKNYESSIQYSRSTDDLVSSYGVDPSNANYNTAYKTIINQLTWQNHYDFSQSSLLVGYDYHKDTAVGYSAGLDKSITQKALFASMVLEGTNAIWNTSVRSDDNSVSSNETTYKVGMAWNASNSFSINANYGTGFKAPSINDLYFPDDGWGTSGNPNLVAETSKGWDIGLKYQSQSAASSSTFSVVYFKQNYDNLIAWQCDPVTWACSPENVDKAVSKGTEVSFDYNNDWMLMRTNWTSLKATNDDTGLWLARRAQESGSIMLGTDLGGFHVEVQTLIVGKRFNDDDNTVVMDSYKKTDVRLSYAINEMWQVKGRIENLNDAEYEDVSGYAVAGRAAYAGVSATF